MNPKKRAKLQNVTAGYFYADEKNANICSELILRGEKTATCSMKYWCESSLEKMPKVDNLQVVTNWNGNPTSTIEIIDLSERKFSEITAEFAALEGEGDKSLKWWSEVHWDFFTTECQEQGG